MRYGIAAAGLLALGLSGCATTGEAPTAGFSVGGRYVAMGSSFGAGPDIASRKPGSPERCNRSTANYASLTAAELGLDLVDRTCGGATTAHILGAWDELPAQIDAVTPDTELVTVTIGGNDIGYVGLFFGGTCREIADPAATCPTAAAPSEQSYAAMEQGLSDVAREVFRRAPNARLVFVEYLHLAPETPCTVAVISQSDLEIGRAASTRLSEVTARVAAEEGADHLPVDQLSQGHTACDAEPWTNAMYPGFERGDGAPWHPNAAGMVASAEALVALLRE